MVALLLSGCLAVSARPQVAERDTLRLEGSVDAMGSTFSVTLYGDEQEAMEGAQNAAFEEARRLDRTLSNYRATSEWSLVNQNAAKGPYGVGAELFGLLAACVEYSRASEGAFDITVGPLMKVWGFFRGDGRLPGKEDVAKALEKVGYKNIALDSGTQSVRFLKPGVEMDPGGIGKGYAVDRMVAVLKEHGIRTALVSAAGSSIYALGAPPSEPKGWLLAIRHPKDETQTVEEIYLKDMSLSTSGNYEKFFEAEGKIYSHIMDPRTGYPAPGMLSASVVAPRTLDSEAWTKPFFINGRRWAAQHKPKDFRVFLCEDKAETACAWLQ